jgi:outer membrane autotransporter protein
MKRQHDRPTPQASRCDPVRILFACVVLATALAARTDTVWADTNNWISGTSASWFTPANWSLGVPPGTGDEAYILTNSTAIIQGSTAATANDLFIQAGGVMVGNVSAGSLTVNGEITVGDLGVSSALTLNIGTISVNTISVGANGSYSDTSSGTIILTGSNPTIQMANGITMVVNSVVAGTSGLTKGGLGTLTLAGDNTYTGGTTISLGTLQVGNGGTTGTLGGGDVTNNSALVFDRSDSLMVSNTITGSGSLTQAGSGTLTLLATNNYSGQTLISAGTLQVGNGGTSGSLGTGAVSNNSALVFDRSDSILVSNAISGVGNLTQAGSGTLTLLATNKYSGQTLITAGTLQVGNGGTSGSLGTGAVSNNSALVFDRSDIVTVSNTITGTGSLTQAGAGTLILAASDTYTGLTIVTSGTLQVGDGGTMGSLGTGAISNNSALVFDRSDSILVSNVISGVGSLTQAGTGTLTLTNVNTYSGGTWVSNGGTLSVLNGHALGSGGLSLINGTLTIGTGMVLYVGGSYTQAAGGTLQIAIGATNAFGQLDVAGSASLAGTVHVAEAGSYVPEHNNTFVLLVASNGVAGTFSALTNDFTYSSLLTNTLVYGADEVTLKWSQLSFVPYALTPNQMAVAKDLDVVASSTVSSAVALVNYLDYLPNPTNDLPVAFDEISPEQLTAMFTMAFAGMDGQAARFLNRVNELRAGYRDLYMDAYSRYGGYDSSSTSSSGNSSSNSLPLQVVRQNLENPWSIYAEGGGEFVDVQSGTNAVGYSLTAGDFTVGLDRWVSDHLVLGGGIGYNGGNASLAHGGNIDMDGFFAQTYAAWFRQGLHVEGMLSGGVNSYDTKRYGLGGFAKGQSDGFEWTGLLNGGYDWQYGAWSFGPLAGIQYMWANIDGFTETGSMAPLHIESQSADAMHTQLGGDLRYRAYIPPTLTFVTPEVSVLWRHDYLADSIALKSALADGAGDAFTVHGPTIGRDSFIINLGVTAQWNPTVSTYINCMVQAGASGYSEDDINAGVRINY